MLADIHEGMLIAMSYILQEVLFISTLKILVFTLLVIKLNAVLSIYTVLME